MKKKYLLVLLTFVTVITCNSQEVLTQRCVDWNIIITSNPSFSIIREMEHHCNDEMGCPVYELGILPAIWVSRDGKCEVSIDIKDKNICYDGDFEVFKNDIFSQYIYNNIKKHLQWGDPYRFPEKKDYKYLKMLLTKYPNKLARKYFNADELYLYPLDIKSECRGKFSHAMVVIPLQRGNGAPPFIHFVMTEDARKNFDRYLKEFQKTVRYKKNKKR